MKKINLLIETPQDKALMTQFAVICVSFKSSVPVYSKLFIAFAMKREQNMDLPKIALLNYFNIIMAFV
jgi:hypothetical protein